MPLNRYDKYFGGARGAAAKAKAQFELTYGKADGEQVFYGTVAKRKHKATKARKRRWGF